MPKVAVGPGLAGVKWRAALSPCPSALDSHEEADLPRSAAGLAERSGAPVVAPACDSGIKILLDRTGNAGKCVVRVRAD